MKLEEAPELVLATDFGLDHNPKLLKRRKETLDDTPEYEIFRTGDDQNGYVILHNKVDHQIDYLIRITFSWGVPLSRKGSASKSLPRAGGAGRR